MPDFFPSSSSESSPSSDSSKSSSSDSFSSFSGDQSDEYFTNNWNGGNLIVGTGETKSYPYVNYNIDQMTLRNGSELEVSVGLDEIEYGLDVSFLCNEFYGNQTSTTTINQVLGPRFLPEYRNLYPIGGSSVTLDSYYPGLTIKSRNTLTHNGIITINDNDSYFEEIDSPNSEVDGKFGNSVSLYGNRLAIGAYDENGGATDSGRVYIYDLSGETWSLTQTLTSPNAQTDGLFGNSVSLYGNRLAIGAYNENGGATDSGRVYIYDLSGETWSLTQTLTSPNAEDFGYFGNSVSLYGNRLAIGAHDEDGGATNSGRVYIYDLSGTWSLTQTLTSPNYEINGRFGNSVSLYGDRLAVGAYRESGGAITDSGRVYIYDLSGTWSLTQTLTSPNAESIGYFGNSVSLYGNRLAIGADYENAGGIGNSGRVYIYDLSGTWSLTQTLASPNAESSGYFGNSVSLYGNRLAIGAHYEDGGATNSGRVYACVLFSNTWITLISPNAEVTGYFGGSVSIHGNRMAIGAENEDGGASSAGRVYIYDLNNNVWSLTQTLTSPNAILNGFFGDSVSLYGDRLAISAYAEHGGAIVDSGQVYIYDLSNGVWSLTQTLTSPNAEVTGYFGWSVSLYESTLAIGAERENGGATDSGRVYIYDLSGETWSLTQTLTSPNATSGGYFGYSISLYGNRLTIGAQNENGEAIADSGQVYIYDLFGTWSLTQTLTSPNAESSGHFGNSVSLYGDRLAIGAFQEDGGEAIYNSGRVYIYDLSGTWSLTQTLSSPNAASSGYFGTLVSLYNKTLIVGTNETVESVSNSGRSYLYGLDNGNFSLSQTLTSPNRKNNGYFGSAAALYADKLAIGARGENRVYLYPLSQHLDICLYGDTVNLGSTFNITSSDNVVQYTIHLKIFANTFNNDSNLDSKILVTVKKPYLLANPWVWGNGTNLGDYDKNQSWINWTYEGTHIPVMTYGNSDTGKLRVRFGQSVVSNVMDMTGANSQNVEMLAITSSMEAYTIYIRGWTVAESYTYNFGEPFDVAHGETEDLSWSLYSGTFNNDWRYMQMKIVVATP